MAGKHRRQETPARFLPSRGLQSAAQPQGGRNVPVPPVLLSAVWVGDLREWPRALVEYFFLDADHAFSDIHDQFNKMTKLLNSLHLSRLILLAV